mgnify:CR=1 FL=1|tara:strand:- start:2391 stop:2933 length:543 start_codon:yes stop_codon:yes gene_type:complete
MKYIITTDTHFGHAMLTGHGYRAAGFEEKILKNLKSISDKENTVLIHLGDFCIGEDTYWNKRFMEVTKDFKQRILVRGNHDNKSYNWYYEHGWNFVCETMRMRVNKKEILFSHMPILGENSHTSPYLKVHKNIHGHLHGNGDYSHRAVEGYDAGFHYDCAVDTHDMKPIYLKEIMNKRHE